MFNKKKFSIIAVIILLLLISYTAGFNIGYNSAPSIGKIEGVINKDARVNDVDFNIFWEAWAEMEKKYVDRKDLKKQDMVYGAVAGMVKSAGDPYTNFFEPKEAEIFKSDVDGSFEGIGAEIGFRKGVLTIITPMDGTPAKHAGLLSGDSILKINSQSTQDMSLEEAVLAIRGEKGTEVTLVIARDGVEEVMDIKITRDTIKLPTISSELKNGSIGYVKLHSFSTNVVSEFENAVKQLKSKGAKKFILDLRNNPGGLLDAAVEISSSFLSKGELVLIENFGNGDGKKEYRSSGKRLLQDIPVVVLINEGSASASEIVAGSVLGKEKIKIVGKKSFGKGSVQELIDLRDGTFLKVTIAKWLTPNEQSIQDNGIEPDITIEITKEDAEQNKDPQLDKALEIINNL